MYRAATMLFGLSACSFNILAGAPADGGPDIDAPIDAPVDSVDAYVVDVPVSLCLTWDPHHFDPCTIPGPAAGLDLSQAGTYTLDTQSGTLLPPSGPGIPLSSAALAQAGGPTAFLISVDSLTVGAAARLRVIGDKPLIVASWGAITIAGTIDVGSRLATTDRLTPAPATLITTIAPGAGANPASCSTGAATAGGPGNSGTGGGGGGGMSGPGGAGGKGDTGGANPGGLGGLVVSAVPSVIRGGCPGAASGAPIAGAGLTAPSTTATTSPPGPGGGAIQLTARAALSITGTITAGGAGGGPAQHGSANGGGGGGAGGMIGLEGATMLITGGTLAANGGGGGSSGMFAGRGFDGQDGQPSSVAAIGGAGDGCSLQAPSGSAGATRAGGGVAAATTASCGGAGGGGGAGFIVAWGTLNGTPSTISPPVQVGPP